MIKMRHRIGGLENTYMGLGADNLPYELDNSWSRNKELNKVADKMLDEALKILFEPNDIFAFDFKVESKNKNFVITFGREPAYKHDPYLMFCITSYYKDSYIKKGKAEGYYGDDVKIEYDKKIIDEDCDEEFIFFVDKWYPLLLETLNHNIIEINK
jgi:hypothetical protein